MDIKTSTLDIRTPDGVMPAHLAQPSTGGPHPGVVVVQEAFGLNGHIKKVAERIAGEGYVALAPDMYYRQSTRAVGYDELPAAIQLMTTLSDGGVLADMGAAIDTLQGLSQTRSDRIGVTGFCMGGRITFLTACRNPAVKAAAPFYGGGIGSVMMPSERTPKAPLEYAESLRAAVLLFFGGDDPFIPMDEVERIKARLAELRKDAETVVYPGAPHGFFCEERDSYRADAASDAWTRLKTFFAKHLQA